MQHHDCAINTTQNAPGASFCASLRSRNALRHHATSQLCSKCHAKCSRSLILCEPAQSKRTFNIMQHHDCAVNATQNAPGAAFCASLRSRNALRHQTTSRCAVNATQSARGQARGPDFARVCARNALRHHATSQLRGKCHAKFSRGLILCEPAQSKRTSTSDNITILRHMPRKVLAARLAGLVLREPALETHFDIIEHHDCAVNSTQSAPGQTRRPHFVRACAVETHFDIIQHSAFLRQMPRKMLAASRAPRSSTGPLLLP